MVGRDEYFPRIGRAATSIGGGSLSAGGKRASLVFQHLHDSVANASSPRQRRLQRSITTGQLGTPATQQQQQQLWSAGAPGNSATQEAEPLLPAQKTESIWKSRAWWALGAVVPLTGKQQEAVFKAVLAYSLAALFTFIVGLRDWLGDPDYISPHLVTNATIWFHAAKTRSGLAEGGFVGTVWVCVTASVTYVALFAAEHVHVYFSGAVAGGETLALAWQSKAITLGVFVFGVSWLLAFFKANAGRPSVGTATAISNIVLYLVMLREGPIVNYKVSGRDSDWPLPGGEESLAESVGKKAEHMLVAVLTGMAVSLCVGWTIRPTTAGAAVRKQVGASVESFRQIVPQLVTAVVGDESAPELSARKLHGAKSEELKGALRAHRVQQQALRKQLAAAALDPTDRRVWGRRAALQGLAAALDGLSLHLSSMSSGLELRVIDHSSDAAALDHGEYAAVIRAIRAPAVRLGVVCDAALAGMREAVEGVLGSGIESDAESMVLDLRAGLQDAVQSFVDDYDAAVGTLDLHAAAAASASTTTEEQLFIVYFFVFSLREFADELSTVLGQAAVVCREPASSKGWASLAGGARWLYSLWQALWDTGATTQMEARYEAAQAGDPRALHAAPRPASRTQRLSQVVWRAGMWARRLNVRFATKYALLITFLAAPWYWSMGTYIELRRQRLEWLVISAAAIMVPTVGGSLLVSAYRVLGTCAGGLAAYLVYEAGDGHALRTYVLLVVVATPFFHIMLHGKYPRIGQFALITFGVVLINKWVAREDQFESAGELAVRRTLAVALGVMAGMAVTLYVWPFEARVRVRQALSWWLLTASVLYERLWAALWRPRTPWSQVATVGDYLDGELQLQSALVEIRALLADTLNEPRLKGPYPIAEYQRIINAGQRLLDAMVAARWVALPMRPDDDNNNNAEGSDLSGTESDDGQVVLNLPIALASTTVLLEREQVELDQCYMRSSSMSLLSMASSSSSGYLELSRLIRERVERDLLTHTAAARAHRDSLVGLTMYVLASALVLKTPLPELPPIEDAQKRVAEAMREVLDPVDDGLDEMESPEHVRKAVARIRYVFYYTQVMLGWEVVHELMIVGGLMRELYGAF
ncbi:hypothetical protein GGF46_003611 [Coemansia sp. RSA 552]|nr:hypothetical protein GGF46_003611 [Coemansia sp. RSA 552]